MLLGEAEAEESVISLPFQNLDLIPANISLAGAEIELVGIDDREYRLRNALQAIKNNYHYVFIDCPLSRAVDYQCPNCSGSSPDTNSM